MTSLFLCARCGRPLTADGRHLAENGAPGFVYVQVCDDCGARFSSGDPWRCPNCGSRHVRDDHAGLPVPTESLPLAGNDGGAA